MGGGDLEMIRSIFDRMEKDGWNTKKELLWGFFFISPDNVSALSNLRAKLEGLGYKFEDIYRDDEDKDWWLHVSKVCIHSPQSLFETDKVMNAIASEADLTFDGWDVGKPEKVQGTKVK